MRIYDFIGRYPYFYPSKLQANAPLLSDCHFLYIIRGLLPLIFKPITHRRPPFSTSPHNFTFILLAQRVITHLFAGFAPPLSFAFGSWTRDIEAFHEK